MTKVKGKLKPLRDNVIVTDMDFGEQKSASGIVILSDDGKDRGIHPRWGKVYAVGPDHKEEYNVGDWILIEHGRWTRGIEFEDDSGETFTIRMVDTNCVLMWDHEKPSNSTIVGELTTPSAPSLEDYRG